METATAIIPARSKRQAMDWSLVLLSQGVEHVVAPTADGAAWELQISGQDEARALNAIQLYQAENRHWPWRRTLLKSDVLFDWASLSWVVLVCLFFWLSGVKSTLESYGEMQGSAVAQGQWWRLFTAIWLHADLSHLASNAVFGMLFLGFAMGRYGTGVGLLAAYLAGAVGNVLSGLLAPQPRVSLGASGMVMGALGLLAVQSLSLWRENPAARKFIVSGLLGGIMLFLLLGVSPGTDLLAHGGGFFAGVLCGAGLVRLPKLSANVSANLASGLLFTVLVLWPWWRALRL